MSSPDLIIHCWRQECDGIRVFTLTGNRPYISNKLENHFVSYVCRNCRQSMKTFALVVEYFGVGTTGKVRKLGEVPQFGPPIPTRAISLIGPDRELFLKGRIDELRGLGIGAFAY